MARGTFTSEQILYGHHKHIPALTEYLCMLFKQEGYEVVSEKLLNGGMSISLTKGGVFKTILGLKSALQITMSPHEENIYIKAGVGIFGQQVIPAIIAACALWPIVITQIWGMVQQSKLDDRVIDIAEEKLYRLSQEEK